jgi:hypothetical protein
VARRLFPILLALMLAALTAACQSASFDPQAPCDRDGRMAGAYPELEALVPGTYEGRAPDRLDSGRSCTPAALGPLAALGIAELRFAGALWATDSSSGVTIAVFQADGLDAAGLLSFYEAGARSARRVEGLSRAVYTAGDGRSFHRLAALNDGSDQTIVTWHDGAVIRAVLVADSVGEVGARAVHDQRVADALDAAGAAPPPDPPAG